MGMPLPATGLITLSAVAEEFRQPTNINIDLDEYVRGGKFVKNIPKNMDVPIAPPISLENLYNARYYFMDVRFNVTKETAPLTSKNGSVSVALTGVSNNYTIKLGSMTAKLLANTTTTFNNLSTGTYNLQITDDENLTKYDFKVNVASNQLVSQPSQPSSQLPVQAREKWIQLVATQDIKQDYKQEIDVSKAFPRGGVSAALVEVKVKQACAYVNGIKLGCTGNNAIRTYTTQVSLKNNKFLYEHKMGGWGTAQSTISVLGEELTTLTPKNVLVQEIQWSANVPDNSIYRFIMEGTSIIVEEMLQNPKAKRFESFKLSYSKSSDNKVLEKGTQTIELKPNQLAFQLLQTENTETTITGNPYSKIVTQPTSANSYRTMILIDTVSQKTKAGITTFSFKQKRTLAPGSLISIKNIKSNELYNTQNSITDITGKISYNLQQTYTLE